MDKMDKIGILLAVVMLSTQAFAHDTAEEAGSWTKRSGIRFGYVYANKSDKPNNKGEEARLKTPHLTTMGLELQQMPICTSKTQSCSE